VERLRYRSTSALDLLAELRQRDLLEEARRIGEGQRGRARSRAGRIGLPWFRRLKS
jgi:hypothetical protein